MERIGYTSAFIFMTTSAHADTASALAAYNLMESLIVLAFKAALVIVFLYMARNISRIRRALEERKE